ncbi:MAG: hypothetical protein Q4G42_03860 [Neisseria sp.]|nr:hypothetical protein [Neisseria sp.]
MKISYLLCVLLAGLAACALVEPTANFNVQTQTALSRSDAVDCAVAAINSVAGSQPNWKTTPLEQDVVNGTVQTGHFSKAGVIGIRVKLVYDPAQRRYAGQIKASGPYYSDLGAKDAAADLSAALAQCR